MEVAVPSRHISFKSVRTRSHARYCVKRPEERSFGPITCFASDALNRPSPFEELFRQRDLFQSEVLCGRRPSYPFECRDERASGHPEPVSEFGNPRWSPSDEADSQIGFNRGG